MKTFDEIFAEIEEQTPQKRVVNLFDDIAKENGRKLVLYGAGGNCELAMFTLSLENIPIACVCDMNATGVYEYEGTRYDIISPMQLLKDYSDAFVLITTWKYEREIMDYLLGLGVPSKQIYYFRFPHLLTVDTFRQKHFEGYRWAYDFFTDGDSRCRIIDRIKLQLWGIPVQPDSLYVDGYFAYPGIKLGDDEIYVDGGAYTGDTAEEFIKEAGDKSYKHIYSFEPDPKNREIAIRNLAEYDNIDIIPYGLWSETTELNFCSSENTMGSNLTTQAQNDTIVVPVTSLDSFFAGKQTNELPTLIKMDIEGSEKEALLGAAEIIKENKPKLMICIYHKPEDIYELPQTITNIRADYKLSLWQIGGSFWDLVLYAV